MMTHLCFGNEHTIFSCVKMKSMTKKRYSVWSDDLFMLMHLLHVNEYDGDFGTTNVYVSIQLAAAALHVKNGTSENPLFCQPFIQRTQINCV